MLGQESSILEKIGVGGIFHFCCQTHDKEKPSAPLIFVLTSYDESTCSVKFRIYRTAFAPGVLVVDYLTDNKRVAFTSKLERPDLMGFLVKREKRLLKKIFDFSDNLPFYMLAV